MSLAWDASPSVVIEYIVHYGTSPGVYTASESAGLSLSKTITALPDGFRYYFMVMAKDSVSESVPSNEVSYRKSFDKPPVRILLQAEFAILENPFVTKSDSDAMTGGYAVSTNNDAGTCTFRVVAPFVDEYVVWARVRCPSDGTDSFYVALNDQAEDVYDAVRVRANIWQWTQVNGRGGINKSFELAWAIEPRLFLMSGSNLIKFRGREQGTDLDAILVTNDQSFSPKAPPSPVLQLNVER